MSAERDRLHAMACELGIAEKVSFIASVEQARLPEYYSAADVCVLPSYYESFGFAALEAAACGKPVIVTDSPAGKARESAGLAQCYRTGNVSDLRHQLQQLLADSEVRERVGQRARDSVLSSLSYDLVASRAEAIMNDAIAAEHGVPVSK